MASSSGDRTDDTSLKPVSSLRAHFEDVSSQTRTQPPLKVAKPAHLSLGNSERGRSSLDLPRKTTTWTTYEQPSSTTSHPPPVNVSTKPVSGHIPVSDATKNFSTSTGTWSPPKSPSIPASRSTAIISKTIHTPLASNNGPVPIATKSQNNNQAIPPIALGPLLQRDLTGASDNPPTPRNLSRKSSPSGFKNRPPPVNRASKPGTPTASTFNLGQSLNVNEVSNKISPFSTPPSSDESPMYGDGDDRTYSYHKTNNAGGYFPPPPVHHVVEAKRESMIERKQDVVVPRTQQAGASNSDHPFNRPVLPMRMENLGLPPQAAQSIQGSPTSLNVPMPPPRPVSTMNTHSTLLTHNKTTKIPSELLPPPPKRNLIPSALSTDSNESASHKISTTSNYSAGAPALPMRNRSEEVKNTSHDSVDSSTLITDASVVEAPNNSQTNRRPPKTKCEANRVWTQYDTRSIDLCGNCVCTGGYIFRAWNITNSRMLTDYAPELKEYRVTSFIFKPSSDPEEEGLYVWLGNNAGEIQEIDLKRQLILEAKPDAHGRREVVKMFRHQNSIWSLDDEGKLLIWPVGQNGSPSLRLAPSLFRLARGHSCSIIVKDYLWIAWGRQIHVYNPMAGENGLHITSQPLSQPGAAEITCCATISSQLEKVYFGHSDGKISVYSANNFTCLNLISASPYKINCLAGAGGYLWAGFNTGIINVYDTLTKPWTVKKEWQAHQKHPVSSIVVDLSSIWKFGHLQVASLGADNAIYFWDGLLEDDWIENEMQQHDIKFCSFREISAAVMTWNAGASTPSSLRYEQKDTNFFREAIRMDVAPDILIFGFQELVDLEDKKLTAKAIFKGSRKKDTVEADHGSYQYRAWRDYLTQVVEESMPQTEAYTLLQTSSMVGLFSCIFVKSYLRSHVRNLKVAEVKRGLGGLHGNKGAIILRFILEDTSLCFVNCHLAAGQSQTSSRNADITAILEATAFPEEKNPDSRINNYIGGGDGAMIMDHEICIINGDLNYRIDTMSRDTVVKAVKSSNLAKLLERDQLIVTKRRNPGMRLRAFQEEAITFAPTYKYDVGTDRFDTSEKARSPAWCDRILYRGLGRVKQIDYRRHELKLSDHRPVSALFMLRLKTINPQQRAVTQTQSEARLAEIKEVWAKDIKLSYFVNVLGIQEREARKMLA